MGEARPRGRSQQGVEEGERPGQGALTAGSGGGGGALPGLLQYRRKGTPWQGRWNKKKEELGQGELTQSLWSSFWSRPAGGPVSELQPAASHPRPLLPSCRCRFLWLRLSLSHELTAPNGLQLPCRSSSSSPFQASERRPTLPPTPTPPSSTLPRPTLPALAGSPEHWGGLSARPHTLGPGLCADALNVCLWSGCLASQTVGTGGQLWLEGLKSKIRSFVLRAKAVRGWNGGEAIGSRELDKHFSDHPFARLQQRNLIKEISKPP